MLKKIHSSLSFFESNMSLKFLSINFSILLTSCSSLRDSDKDMRNCSDQDGPQVLCGNSKLHIL